MYDVYTLVTYTEGGVAFDPITLDTDATLSELCDEVRVILAHNEECLGEIHSYDVYAGEIDLSGHHIDWDSATPIALDIC